MATWQINQLDRNTADGFVLTVHWQCVDEGARVYSTVSFPYNAEQPDFIPYADLTEEVVIGWVKASLGDDGVAATEAAIAAQIEAKNNPPVSTGLPWAVSQE